jgi:acyl dehydratase
MPLIPEMLLKRAPIEALDTLTPQRAILYALGIGAEELEFLYERNLKALPTMAAILARPDASWIDPAAGITATHMMHAETSVVLHAPLPVTGTVKSTTVIGPIIDKGADKGAILYQTRTLTDAVGAPLATLRDGIFLRADGGFGGSPTGGPAPSPVPDRAPDHVEHSPTSPTQHALYRLSGDLNPLHIDPRAATKLGYRMPILHGLATFGIAGRALMRVLAGNDPARVRRVDARFTAPVYPGETIVTHIWNEGSGRAAFRCRVAEREAKVLDHGVCEWDDEPTRRRTSVPKT